MAKKKKTKNKAKTKVEKKEKKEEAPDEEVKVEEVSEEEAKPEIETKEEKPAKEATKDLAPAEESKSEKRMRLSILLLSMVCVLLWGSLLYLLNQTYMINDNYQELIMKVDTLTSLYEKAEDIDEVRNDEDAVDDSDMDEDIDDSEDTDDDEEVTLMERTFECDHPYSDGEGPTGSMTLRYPEGVTITDSSPSSMPYACMLDVTYMSGTLYLNYSNGEAYPKQLDADIVQLKTVGEDILVRGPLQFYPESDIYAEAGYRTSYDMRSPDSECVDSEIWGPMAPPCGIPGNQFLTFLGSSYVVIDEGTSESERAQIVEVFDTINIESEGGPYDE